MKISIDRNYLETLKNNLLNHDYVTFKNKAMVSFMNGQFSHSKNYYTHSLANQIKTIYRSTLDEYQQMGVWLVAYSKDFRFLEKTISNGYPVGNYSNELLQKKVSEFNSLSGFPDMKTVSFFDQNRKPCITYSFKRNETYVPPLKVGDSLLIDGAIGVGYYNYKEALQKVRPILQVDFKQRKLMGVLDVDPYGNVFNFYKKDGISLEQIMHDKTGILLVALADLNGNLIAWMSINDFVASYMHGDPFQLDLPKLKETDTPSKKEKEVSNIDSKSGCYLVSKWKSGIDSRLFKNYSLTNSHLLQVKR